MGDLGGTTRPSTAPPAPQVKVDQPHRESWSRSRSRPKPSTPPASTSHLPTTLLSLAPAASSLQPFVLHQSPTSRCSTPPVSTESLPLSRPQLHSPVSSSQDDSEWKQHQQQRASMSCGRRVVHHLVAATLVAHWPHHGGASLPFPPLTLTPGQDLRGDLLIGVPLTHLLPAIGHNTEYKSR